MGQKNVNHGKNDDEVNAFDSGMESIDAFKKINYGMELVVNKTGNQFESILVSTVDPKRKRGDMYELGQKNGFDVGLKMKKKVGGESEKDPSIQEMDQNETGSSENRLLADAGFQARRTL